MLGELSEHIIGIQVQVVAQLRQQQRAHSQIFQQLKVARWLDVVFVVTIRHRQAQMVEDLTREW